MKPSNLALLRESFTAQAAGFESGSYHLSKKEYLDYLVLRCEPKAADQILEVAAGTRVCGRTLAPLLWAYHLPGSDAHHAGTGPEGSGKAGPCQHDLGTVYDLDTDQPVDLKKLAEGLKPVHEINRENVTMNKAEIGDLIEISNAGSYGYSLSPLLFANHTAPKQYMIDM